MSPVYKAELLIEKLVQEITTNVKKITNEYEIILVDDGSPGQDWTKIKEQCHNDDKIIGIKLSRNFGQHNAITAGLSLSKGEWVVVMDCDLQDRPEEIINLFNKSQEGFDIVLARRAIRRDSFIKKYTSKLFYKIFSYLTETKQDPAIANFGIYHRKVIDAVLSMGDYIRVFPILVQWVGFKKTTIDIKHDSRQEGKSSYTLFKLFSLATNMIISFSEKPLKIGLKIGLITILSSFLSGLYNLVRYFNGYILVPGYTSLIISIWFMSGLIIAFLGLIGLYISKIFEKVKERPCFIIENKINYDEKY